MKFSPDCTIIKRFNMINSSLFAPNIAACAELSSSLHTTMTGSETEIELGCPGPRSFSFLLATSSYIHSSPSIREGTYFRVQNSFTFATLAAKMA